MNNFKEKFKFLSNEAKIVFINIIEYIKHMRPDMQAKLHHSMDNLVIYVKDGFIAVKLKNIYHRCLYYLIHEVTQAQLYFGVCCFLMGGFVGIQFGRYMNSTIVAPQRMRAVISKGYHGIDNVCFVEDVATPNIIKKNQLLVKVEAATIDNIDVNISKGYGKTLRQYVNKNNPNCLNKDCVVLGRDCAGVVLSTGIDVKQFNSGDEVWLSVPFYYEGTLREKIVVEEKYVAHKPTQISFEGAAALPSDIMRSWDALVVRGGLGDLSTVGKRVLVKTGVSGVTFVAIQMVRSWGGHVTAIIPSQLIPFAKTLEANEYIEEETDFMSLFDQKEKFDVIFIDDSKEYSKYKKFCTDEGFVVTTGYKKLSEDRYGFLTRTLHSLYLNIFYLFSSEFNNGGIGYYSSEINGRYLQHVRHLIAAGDLRAVLDRTYSIQDAELAIHNVAHNMCVGKSVLKL